eukprot:Colp12_sorted_trinity150504_noHs@27277
MYSPNVMRPPMGAQPRRMSTGSAAMGGMSPSPPETPDVSGMSEPSPYMFQNRPPPGSRPQRFSDVSNLSRQNTNRCTLRLLLFNEYLSRHPEDNSIEWWLWFVGEFFSENGVMKYSLWNAEFQENRAFELTTALLARFYKNNFDSGVEEMSLTLENPREYTLPNGYMMVDCSRAAINYLFDQQSLVVCTGHLRVTFTSNCKMLVWEFHTKRHREYIPRDLVVAQSESQRQNGQGPENGFQLPESPVNEFGITVRTMRCLQIAEVVCHMKDLIKHTTLTGMGHWNPSKTMLKRFSKLAVWKVIEGRHLTHPRQRCQAQTSSNHLAKPFLSANPLHQGFRWQEGLDQQMRLLNDVN